MVRMGCGCSLHGVDPVTQGDGDHEYEDDGFDGGIDGFGSG